MASLVIVHDRAGSTGLPLSNKRPGVWVQALFSAHSSAKSGASDDDVEVNSHHTSYPVKGGYAFTMV
jgi:hypothetical protein